MTSIHKLAPVLDLALTGGGRITLRIAGNSLLYFQISTSRDQQPDHSYAVVKADWNSPSHDVAMGVGGATILTTATLRVSVSAEPFSLVVEDRGGNVLFATTNKDALSLDDGRIRLRRKLDRKEAVYGLGEHGEGLNRNPGIHRIWNRDEFMHHPFKQYYCTIPFAVCGGVPGAGFHGMFVDNPGELFFDVGISDPAALHVETRHGDLKLWLMFEETPALVLRDYTELTGRMELPPLWALGFQQCRWSYMTADRVREIAREYRTRRIPCDVIYLDIDYMQDFAVFTWNAKTFAEPESLIGDLGKDGFTTLCIVDPGVAIRTGYHAYDIGMTTTGFFLRHESGELFVGKVWPGEVHMPDFTNPQTRRLWGEWQQRALLDVGIAGIWNDMNEPAIFGNECGSREFPADVIHHDFGMKRRHEEIHNVFGLTMAQASRDGQLASFPRRRPFTLTRSGWAGVQKHSAVWTGDNRSAFSTMALDVALNLNMGMSGVGFVGCDIGGFQGNATPELFARWIEWGVFQPFCRAHSAAGSFDHEPWAFGPEVETIARRMIELRYQLLPYIYAQFVECARTGMPVNRPLALAYPQDATALSIGDQFLLGGDLLVAPILEQGKDHRAIYLPAGDWFDYWSGTRHGGGKWILAAGPFGKPPLFVRAGAIIPMHPIRQSTRTPEPETTFFDVWVAPEMSGLVVDDDGISRAHLDGEQSIVTISGRGDGKFLDLQIGAPVGSYRGARKFWHLRIHGVSGAIASITHEGKTLNHEQDRQFISCVIPNANTATSLRIQIT
ncbi:MAG TPA: glycoside hydrolase family 31 protein [Candidatus Sumerlaeota bacterium]|nr:glycoside hydrolase family 31 protein [Candidatus Sumerlaeota bacterium]